jgi:hypothetical protein
VDDCGCGDDPVERIAEGKIEFEGQAGDFRSDQNHAETSGHLGKLDSHAVRKLNQPFGSEVGNLEKHHTWSPLSFTN